ncbi:PhaM family polyhydroxyalkanoate granule multifunctional regulatory protein [Bordetella avium]|uniref:Regulatory protein n=1 Tax=Bordetella avium (strain 197N) TaxID=360910 RepID=Q2KTX4_BORA1|nr:PhaM family polyhydroxyalkanoate granule multifunctional regulatory protein [Bordetella avium]AZY50599.1 transcriptional regulator [Bordetella avium]AZY53996.1 transcriptional regulator [Bordetella avium]RIQ15232.1 transcriptional regulator [Bordetella avium]RIQ19963.1 transcriptional regulator [Bordetella avium]RIQ34543.1 transcriptional regulator [Bordetella avium]
MTDSNPFILPGLGQNADRNPLLASMEMMRQAWAGLAGPGGLGASLPLTPALSLEELERRITELRAVETWLRLNLQMLTSSIQGLEVQRATIATLRSFVGSAAEGGPSPLEAVLGIKPAAASEEEPAAAPAAESVNAAAQSASQAWWDLLNQQFGHIAAATAASMPGAAAQETPAQAKPASKPAAKTAAKATVKTASKTAGRPVKSAAAARSKSKRAD